MNDSGWEGQMLEGRCICGEIRYRARDERIFEVICCCDDCQRASGSGHLPVIGVRRAGFELRGEPRTYVTSEEGAAPLTRSFCGTCGSMMFAVPHRFPQLVTIYAGGLERPKRFSPTTALFVGQKCAWDVLPKNLNEWVGTFGDSESGVDHHGP